LTEQNKRIVLKATDIALWYNDIATQINILRTVTIPESLTREDASKALVIDGFLWKLPKAGNNKGDKRMKEDMMMND
jgi:hypothetical protein